MVKPQLKSKMQHLLAQHSKPAPKTAVKTVQLAKKVVPAAKAKAPAPRVAKTPKLGLAQVNTLSDAGSELLDSIGPESMHNLL